MTASAKLFGFLWHFDVERIKWGTCERLPLYGKAKTK